jgi:putative oxygen-independent coproporphyrinogen III oxidase
VIKAATKVHIEKRNSESGRGQTQAKAKPIPDGALSEQAISLYVHLPFCVSKCRYCDFNSYAWTGQNLQAHVDAVLLEADRRARDLKPQTVFIGGGTPSLLAAEMLHDFLRGLNQITGFVDSSIETTLEANPESLDLETAQAAAAGGVNRLSVGVQSLRPEVLQAYDRVHSPAQAIAALRIAAENFARYNADLIFAFPGQDPQAWERDLRAVIELGPDHLSCYELSYEPGTALTRLRNAGRWQAEDPDLCEQLFHRTGTIAAEAGYQRYEVSNFAQAGSACLHNLAAWRSLPYVGIGAGAASWINPIRRKNIERPDLYERAVLDGIDPVAESETLAPRTIAFDMLMMGLRLTTEGVSRSRVKRISGLDPIKLHPQALADFACQGLLEIDQNRIRTTAQGLLLLDSILAKLLPGSPV